MLTKLTDYIADKAESKRKDRPFWLFKFTKSAYFKDLNITRLKRNIVVIIIILLFSEYIVNTVLTTLFEFIYNNINRNALTHLIIYYGFTAYSIVFFFNKITRGYLPTFNSLLTFMMYWLLYLFLLRRNQDFTFLPLDYQIKFIDLIFIGTSLFCAKWSLYFNRQDTSFKEYQFVTDENNKPDLFGYTGLSEELNKYIHHTETCHSFAIGILGNWGDGKTYLANLIINHFSKFEDDYIIVEFNPWMYKKEQLLDVFFDEFLNIASLIDRSLKNDFASYAEKVTSGSETEQIQLFNFAFKLFSDNKSIDELKKTISEKIRLSRKKVIVFIDDTDRLDQEEISEVLKIVRNSADFANTFFIMGMDYEHINSKIENPKYLEKIFNVLVALPKISPSTFKDEIIKKFDEHFPQDANLKNSLKDLIQYDWFIYFLKNLRQLHRLINSFKISYNILRNNVDITDLLILEILKNGATIIYNKIYNEKAVKFNSLNASINYNNLEGWKIDLDDSSKEEKDECKCKFEAEEEAIHALEHLINRTENKHMRSFANGYELMYFNYANTGINIIEFYQTIESSDKDSVVMKFNEWISNDDPANGKDYKRELMDLLTLHLSKKILKNPEEYLPIFLELNDYNFSTTVYRDIYLNSIINQDDESTEDYALKILEILKNTIENNQNEENKNIPVAVFEWSSDLFIHLLRSSKDNTQSSELPEKYQKIANELYELSFRKVIDIPSIPFAQKYEIFKKGVLKIENNTFKYSSIVKDLFKTFVLKSEQNKIDLLKASIVPYWSNQYDNNFREIVIIDFLSLIFENKDELLTETSGLQSSEIDPLVSFMKLHIDEYYEFRQSGNTFTRYVKDDDLHKNLLVYFDKQKVSKEDNEAKREQLMDRLARSRRKNG